MGVKDGLSTAGKRMVGDTTSTNAAGTQHNSTHRPTIKAILVPIHSLNTSSGNLQKHLAFSTS